MNHVQSLRIKAGMTQKELAVAAGCTQPSISAIEGGAVPRVDLARSIVGALNATGMVAVTMDDVFPPAEQEQAA